MWMKTRILSIGLLAAWALPGTTEAYGLGQQEHAAAAPNGPCRIAGTWVGNSPPFLPEIGDQTLIFAETITPIDDSCQRFSSVLTAVNPELTFSGLFPEAEGTSDLYATLVRDGANRYRVLLATTYFTAPPPEGVPIRGRVIYFWTYSGTVTCIDAGCTEKLQEGTLSLYSNIEDPDRVFPPLGVFGVVDQDTDDDGFADPGTVPIFEAPFPLASRRLME